MADPLRKHSPKPDPCAVVIFGASGDLTSRKLLPAFWNLFMEGHLPEGFSVIGMARTSMTDETFREQAREAIEEHSRFREPEESKWREFAARLHYQVGQYDDPAAYQELQNRLGSVCRTQGSCDNHLFYLATPPSAYGLIVTRLGEAGLTASDSERGGWARVIVEKPFGYDAKSAHELNETLKAHLSERQIYRIDHYLGKETVQNLLVFRLANGIWEPIWNRRYIDHVQISVAEKIGVEDRGSYYEEAGALRDMVQNHLMQLLCLVAMEPPSHFNDRGVRGEKMKVLEAIRPIRRDEVAEWSVRGQYSAAVIDGDEVPGYRQENGVAPDSVTETYAAVKLMVDNWRWAGVPFYLRSGKRLPDRVTEISIHFRQAPQLLFRDYGEEPPEQNVLTIRIQPNEGIALRFGVKAPGQGMPIRPVTMEFDYGEEFGAEPPEAYERLLLDCMLGDVTLFSRDDWMELSWQLMDPVIEEWSSKGASVPQYRAGTWGPREADELLERDGRSWWIS